MPPVYRPIQDGAAFSKQYVGESVAVAIWNPRNQLVCRVPRFSQGSETRMLLRGSKHLHCPISVRMSEYFMGTWRFRRRACPSDGCDRPSSAWNLNWLDRFKMALHFHWASCRGRLWVALLKAEKFGHCREEGGGNICQERIDARSESQGTKASMQICACLKSHAWPDSACAHRIRDGVLTAPEHIAALKQNKAKQNTWN
jgi:hypothetical protein